jgi:hypothetical protein
MIEAVIYWFMQILGYRKMHYDLAFARNIMLTSYDGWSWYPEWPKGTYREIHNGWRFAGYGTDK